MDSTHETFMRAALEEAALARAEGNMGVGSVIVRDGAVIERGHNMVDSTFDLTAHAETVALRNFTIRRREAIPYYGTATGVLTGHTLYTTVEPCGMCAFACCLAGVSTIVIGARFARLGSTAYGDYAIEKLIAMIGARIEIVSGVLYEECAALRAASLR